jgi:hypothetical protein
MRQPQGVQSSQSFTIKSININRSSEPSAKAKAAILHKCIIEKLGQSSAVVGCSIMPNYVNIAWEKHYCHATFCNGFYRLKINNENKNCCCGFWWL